MNILYICHVDFDGSFGDSVRVRELVSNLSSKNDVTVVAPTKTSGFTDTRISDFKRLRKLHLRRFGQASDTISSIISLLNTRRRKEYDIVFETFGGPFSVSCYIKRLIHLPVVVELHGVITEEERSYGVSHLYSEVIHRELIKKNLQQADGIVAVTSGNKRKFCEIYGLRQDRIRVIPNGANTRFFRPMSGNTVRKMLNLDNENFYVGFVGNLAPWQGLEYLITMAPTIIKRCKKNVVFLVVGDGIMKDSLENMVGDNGLSSRFIFTGQVKRNMVPKYINSFDLCVAPFNPHFLMDASPLKIFDYMACGKAIVASNITGVADLLISSKAGLVASPEKPEDFAGAISELLNDDDLRRTLGQNGLNEVRRHHDWRIRADELNRFLEETLKASRSS